MRPQISEGFGSEWILIHNNSKIITHGKEGIAVILFPETDTSSFLAVKRLLEVLPPDEPIKKILSGIIRRIEAEHQEIIQAGTWEK